MARTRATMVNLAGLTAGMVAAGGPAAADPGQPVSRKGPLAVGTGGAVATVDQATLRRPSSARVPWAAGS